MQALEMITNGRNAKVCDDISAECGWYLTGFDIDRGKFGCDDNPTFLNVMEILKNGGIKLKMWDGESTEVIDMDRITLPEGGYIFAQIGCSETGD